MRDILVTPAVAAEAEIECAPGFRKPAALTDRACSLKQGKKKRPMAETAKIPESEAEFIEVGRDAGTRRIAVRARRGGPPGLFWLSGFNSDMQGTKALALDAWAAEHGRGCVRFDYSGHGSSGGRFTD